MLTRAQVQEVVTRRCGGLKVQVEALRGDESATRGYHLWCLSTDVGTDHIGITFRSTDPISEAERCASELAAGAKNPASVPLSQDYTAC